MPALGFAPDAEFPAIHGEKGITTFDLVQNVSSLILIIQKQTSFI